MHKAKTNKTRIICTIGPAVCSLHKITQLLHEGMNVARLNFSHGTHVEHLETIKLLKEAREKEGCSLAIMLDTKGPEIRLGKIKNDKIELKIDQKWHLVKNKELGDEDSVSITPAHILDELKEGMTILFNDGYISSHVIQKTTEGVVVQMHNAGVLSSHKGINIPNVFLSLPAMTPQDIQDIEFGCEQGIECIAASFIRSAEHVREIKEILARKGCSDVLVIAKIENQEGIQNFDAILQEADGIMIARGDLGVEVPFSHVPRLQKKMIKKCYLAGKPVITATQMLESMINHRIPSRAEASDVANAIYDLSDAVMLSAETAIGKYPLEAVRVMRRIIADTEADIDYQEFFTKQLFSSLLDVPSVVTRACVEAAYGLKAKAIFTFTKKGSTARLLARVRPKMPIVALTADMKVFHRLSFYWGVIPFYCSPEPSMQESFTEMSRLAMERKLVSNDDKVVVAIGDPFGMAGTTNSMVVETIKEFTV